MALHQNEMAFRVVVVALLMLFVAIAFMMSDGGVDIDRKQNVVMIMRAARCRTQW